MITRSKAKPPQFGYIYLGFGFYLSTDPFAALFHHFGKYHWWDSLYRVKWRVPYFFYDLEHRRHR